MLCQLCYFNCTEKPDFLEKSGFCSAQIYIYFKNFPIRTIDFTNSDDKSLHDQMVSLVDQMLDLHKKFKEASLPQEKNVLQRQIEAADSQIDQLVYKLYALTEEEIKIVESDS